ncbi:glycosyltransferase family 1 protein [Leifsonia flava]|uniref:Glycosyltransferase family 1 protein n=1 Tax=Orlajensenia leifsoniae TaxID=2561933 RepID=A0A4Y9R795_9MICO|nr:glycosyltransferase family 1 protein [Leifsonia flava]
MPGRERWLVPVTEYAGVTAYTGGIGRHYAALVPALARRGIDVDLLVFSDSALIRETDDPGVELRGVRIGRRVPRIIALPLMALRVRRAFAARTYDRVFAPEWSGLGAALPSRAPLLTNLATSMRLSNEVAHLRPRDLPASTRLAVAVQNRLEDRQIRRSAGLIAISQAMARWTSGSFATLPPVRVVWNCIEVTRVESASRSADLPDRWPASDGPIVLFLGRLERRKGIVDALKAFAIVSAQVPSARLVLAGSSGDRRFEPDREELLGYLPAASRDQVAWLGHVGGDELYRAIREAAVTICPSLWEGFGNVALEVRSIGAPLVCTTGSGFDDFCTSGVDCLMVPPADAAGLARAISRIIGDPAFGAALGLAGQADVGRFAPDRIAADLTHAADELLGPVRP